MYLLVLATIHNFCTLPKVFTIIFINDRGKKQDETNDHSNIFFITDESTTLLIDFHTINERPQSTSLMF